MANNPGEQNVPWWETLVTILPFHTPVSQPFSAWCDSTYLQRKVKSVFSRLNTTGMAIPAGTAHSTQKEQMYSWLTNCISLSIRKSQIHVDRLPGERPLSAPLSRNPELGSNVGSSSGVALTVQTLSSNLETEKIWIANDVKNTSVRSKGKNSQRCSKDITCIRHNSSLLRFLVPW